MNQNNIKERIAKSCTYAEQCLRDEAQAVLELIPQLDSNFEKAVEMGCGGV